MTALAFDGHAVETYEQPVNNGVTLEPWRGLRIDGGVFGPWRTEAEAVAAAPAIVARIDRAAELKAKTRHVRVDALRAGDYLPTTKRTVTAVYRGINTPSRCHTVEFRRDNGRTGLAHWRSETVVDVVREEPTF